ncbi:MAG: flavin-containing monooxygenase, partial [Microthrixaceae bacterium]
RFAHLLEDPYVEKAERAPVRDEVTVALIGAGFSGLCVGARLKEAGINDLRLIDGGGDVGGAWYWNRYPGAMCDTAAMIYLPLLEETGYMPSMKYVYGAEIYEHARRIAKQYDLWRNGLFSTQVESLEWDDESDRWVISTNRGDTVRARFVAMGTGPLNIPKLPGIAGIESFAGHAFHTARWDYDYTGGGPGGAPMENLADKRVGIIGTGATAVQCIPALARDARELYVFQRTPSSIDVRNNHPIDPDEFAKLESGWQREWLMNFATLQTGGFADVDHVKDGWTDIAQRIRDRIFEEVSSGGGDSDNPLAVMLRAYEESDDEKMDEIRARCEQVVEDPATAEMLKPWYRQLCKRPCFHDEYLQAYNEPGCHLVDTDGQGVERIDEAGVWANGEHHDLDCIVFASGFEVSISHKANYETVGRGGVKLSDRWADGMQSLHGVHVHSFPNLFIIGLSQGANLISNITSNLDEAGKSIAAVVSHAEEVGAAEVEATEEAEQAWVAQFDTSGGAGILGSPDCTPGYYNNEGQPLGRRERLNAAGYPQGPVAYFNYIHRWRTKGNFDGLQFSGTR